MAKVINAGTIIEQIGTYRSYFESKYGISSSFYNKLSFPSRNKLIGSVRVIPVQMSETIIRNTMEENVRKFTQLLIGNGFPAAFDTTQSAYEIKIKNITVRFLKPKREFASLTTEMQEKGAICVFNRAKEPGVEFKTWQDIMKDNVTAKGLTEIFKSFGEVPESWLVSYFKQQKKLFSVLGKDGWDEIDYKDSKSVMSEIKTLLENVTFDSKRIKYENWNPSDIWLVKNKNDVLEELRGNIINSHHSQTLQELNDKLLKLIKEERLIGVSLKKVPTRQNEARFVYVNISPQKSITFNLTKNQQNVKIAMNLKYDSNKKKKTIESTFVSIGDYKMQIKSNAGSSSDSNLKFEGLSKGLGGRAGKAPLDYVSDLMKDYKIGRLLNDWTRYPENADKFLQNNSYERVFNTLKSKSNIDLGVKTYDEFKQSILSLYSESDVKWHRIARTKLMEMIFVYQTTKLKTNLYEDFWKDMIYLSLKEGAKFSPHGKLY